MESLSPDKLHLAILFLIPGFIGMKTYQVVTSVAPQESSKQLIDAFAYSCFTYALLSAPILAIETSGFRTRHPSQYLAFWTFVLLFAPILIAFAYYKLRQTAFMQRFAPHPSFRAWDYVFQQRKEYFMVVSMKDGSRVGGYYGSSSFSSSAPAPGQLFLEEAWVVNDDGGLDRPLEQTNGLLIVAPDIRYIQFFRVDYGESNGQ